MNFDDLMKKTSKSLSDFGNKVIKQSRTNLTKGDHNRTYRLYKSLDYDLVMHPNSIEYSFNMMYYGWFLDQGTKRGIRPTYFFSKPFETDFNKLDDDVVEAFALELDSFLKYTLDEVFKDINSKKK